MAYCVVADIRLNLDRFTVTQITDVDVQAFITKADGEIDSVLANYYTLPFVVTIPLLKSISTDLASYYVLRRNYTRDSVETSDWVMQFREDAENKLKDIKEGKISLVDDSGNVVDFASDRVQHNNEDYTPTFDQGDPLEWEVDPDRITDIEDAK